MDVFLSYLFFKVANVAQVESDHFNHCDKDQPSYEQSLVVSRKIVIL